MSLLNKWLGGIAAAALVAAFSPAAFADDTVVVPSGGTTTEGSSPSGTQETVVPGEAGGSTVVVTTPRTAAPVNQTLIEIGGGAETYTDKLGDQLQGGVGWTGRVTLGARSPLGLELAYSGAINPIEGNNISGLGDFNNLDTNNSLVTNQGEALARYNFAGPRAMIKPFLAGGANYTRMDSNTTLDNLDAIGFPLAAGLQFYPASNFTIGARGEYKILTGWLDTNLPNGNEWGGMLTVGANF